MEKENIKTERIDFNEFDSYYTNLKTKDDEFILSELSKLKKYEQQNKGTDYESLMIKFIEHKNPSIRIFILEYLKKSNDITTLREVKKILMKEKDISIIFKSIALLERWIREFSYKNKTKELNKAVEYVMNLISQSSNKKIINRLTEIISYSNNKDIDALIMNNLNTNKTSDKISSIKSMRNSSDSKWIPFIREFLDDNDPLIRALACSALGNIGEEEHIELLIDLLEDENLDTQKSSVLAIYNIGGNYALNLLEGLKFSTEPEIIELSKKCVIKINKEKQLDHTITPEKLSQGFFGERRKISSNEEFDEYDAANVEGWGSLNTDGTSFIAPDAIDDDIDDPIKSLSDYEKPIEQPDIDD
jgi:hypothetical protein|tara:strand:+ start:4249 stop:5328 length:1080 start_codon:yes stop_codon:yes gene_type:complete